MTAKKDNKKPTGRPKSIIDWKEMDKLCAIHATRQEIGAWFGVHEDTIERACRKAHGIPFAAYFQQKSGVGKVSLRRRQFQMAQNGDRTMLIWLGKQLLGQSEKVDQTNVNKNHFVIELTNGTEIHMGTGDRKEILNGKKDEEEND